jgi:hypothetical protein
MNTNLAKILLSGLVVGAFIPSAVHAEEKPMGTESVPVVYHATTTNQAFLPKLGSEALFKIDDASSKDLVKPQELYDPFAQDQDGDAGFGAQALADANDDAEANERHCPHYQVPGLSSFISLSQNMLTVQNTGEVREIAGVQVERNAHGLFEVQVTDTQLCTYVFSADTRSDALVLWESLTDMTWNMSKSMTVLVTDEHPHYDILKVEMKGAYFRSR